MPIVTLVSRNARQWVFPALCVLGLFLILSYGCGGGGGGGGGSIVLPPYATTGTITGSVTSTGNIVASIPALRAAGGVPQAEVWLEDQPGLRTTTGADGAFALENVPFGTRRVVARFLNQTTGKTFKIRSNPVAVVDTVPVVSAGNLQIEEATNQIQGILSDADGNPIANAQMTLWGETFSTDANGRFITPPLPAQESSADLIVAMAAGFKSRTFTVGLQNGTVPEIEILLTRTGAVQNAPVARLTVSQTEITPNQQVQLFADASDPDDANRENLTVDWSVTAGVIATSTNRWTKLWTAPDLNTTATATVTITDPTGLQASARIGLKVGSGNQQVNQRPVASNVRVTGSSGDVQILFNLADAEQDPLSVSVFFSTDGGANFTRTTNLTGSDSQLIPGADRSLIWQSAADVAGQNSQVMVRVIPADAGGAGTGATSTVFTLNNSTGNQPPAVTQVRTTGNSGDIAITFNLTDANDDDCSISAFYSTDGGTSFTQTNRLVGNTTGIQPGNDLTLTWNSAADITGNQAGVVIRLVPNDGSVSGTPGESSAFAIANNGLPTVANVVYSGSSGDILLGYDLSDPNNDPCTVEVYFSTDNGANYRRTTALTGTTSSITPGVGKTLTWNSPVDIPGSQSSVKIKIIANDGSASGIPGESSVFAVNNNTLPVVTNVVASGTSGNFVLTFELADANNDACNVSIAYSIDGGTSFTPTSNVTGKTSGINPGLASLTWNSAADISGNLSTVKIRVTPSDAVGSGTAGISAAFAVSNNNLPVVSAVTPGGSSGNITITYTLADPNNDPCSLKVFYSTDNGANYTETTSLTGSLTGVTPGSGKTLTWNSTADVTGNSSGVRIKISANDGAGDGTPGESVSFTVSNNTLPVVTAVSTSGTSGDIAVSFNLADANNHACSIAVLYSTDGTTFLPTTNVTGKTSEINPGVASITWNSAADINGNQSNVKIRIVPNDGVGDGTAGDSPAFAVSNNNLPVVSSVTTSGNSGNIVVTYNLADPNNDPCNISVFYSSDNGVNFAQTTNISGSTTNVTPGSGKTLTWNSLLDVNTNAANVIIKVAASDGAGNGTPAVSAAFAVNNNQLPSVSSVAVSGSSGDLSVTYTLADANNDACNVNVFYSTDNGVSYTQTSNITGSATGVIPGANKTLTWRSALDVNRNAATVKIRLVPADRVGTGSGAESAAFAVNNNQLPVVANVSTSGTAGNITVNFDLSDVNNDNCSLIVAYSTDGGTSFINTTSIIGAVTGVAPGTGRTLTWRSADDLSGSQADVKIRIQPADGVGNGTAGISPSFAISNNQPPAVTNVSAAGSVGDITISYVLADSNSDPCSIVFSYSLDGGVNYFQTGNVTGSTTGVIPGTRSIVWNSSTDIPGSQNNVRVKIRPNDGSVDGAEGQSAVFSVNNNNLPVASNVTTAGSSGDIVITYNLSDANGDNCAINIFYSTDNGTSYTQTTNLSGSIANIPPGTGKTVTWNSALDVAGNATQVKVKVVPRDVSGTGAAAESAVFTVNNNSAPVVSSVIASGTSGDITVSYTLADNESDPCSVTLAYSINGGTSYSATTNITGTVTGLAPGVKTLVWRSTLDVTTDQAAVRVRVVANDGNTSSSPADSATFSLNNSNQPATVSQVTTIGNTGAVTISYKLEDPNSDPCSIAVFYSTNGGANYAQTMNITGLTTNITPGMRTISWNSPPDINGSLGNVRVRVVPTDRGGVGTGGDSALFSVDNVGRPVVSSVTTTGSRGNIIISYDYNDPDGNAGALQVYYSLDNGLNFIKSNALTGQLTGITNGARTITWNSAAEVSGSYPEVLVRVLMNDGTGIGTPGTSAAFSLTNDGLPTVLRIINSGTSGQIVLGYDLVDPNSDLCSIEVYYSTDGGLNYTKTTSLMSGLVSDIIPGSGKAITWNSTADIMGYYPNTKIKIIPSDTAGAGIPGESMVFPLRNNRLPVVSAAVTSGNSGDISVTYTLADADGDPCSITPEYSTNNGATWFPTYNYDADLSAVTPGAGKTFVWRSADDFLSTYAQVRLRLTPNDGAGNGTTGMTTAFAVANNSLPSIANVTTSGNAGAVTVSFDLADGENNPCSITLHYSVNGGVSYTQSAFVSGQTTNVLPGAGNTIVWESSNNVSTNVSDVRIRLVPNDGTGNGTAGVSPSFGLNNDNNSPPAITALSRTGTSGNITFTYTLADANGDSCATNLYYSTDGGSTFYLSRNTSGAVTGVLPGSGRTLLWNSLLDVNSTVNNVLVKLVPQDSRAEGTSMTTAAFNISNNSLPAISNVTATGDSGPISISYSLADSNADACNITVYFSIDGGLTFNPTTNISGLLSGVAPGNNRSLTWNSAADIPGNQNGVRIRLVPGDSFGSGSSAETVSFAVSNNKLPVVSSVTTSGTSGNITITYNLADANNNNCSIEVFYSTDGGVNYIPTDSLTGVTTNIASGTGKTIVWNSAANINRNQSNVRVRIVPSDQYGVGTGANSSSLTVLNNQAPVVSAVTPVGTAGNIVITYNLADANDNPSSILFYYSTNGGVSYTLSTNITGLTSNLMPGNGKVITWNSVADINTDLATVRVRIVANDGTVNGTPGDSATISILNNQSPSVSNVRYSGTTGDIIVTYDISDGNNDAASISLEYTTDNGATYSPIDPANLTGLTSGITPGTNKTITWNSAADITGDRPAVRVRISITDGIDVGTPGESTGFAIANNNLPVVSGVETAGAAGNISITYDLADANNNSCSIAVYYSLDNGASFAQTSNITGATTGLLPGNDKTVTWNSLLDVPGSASQVKIKVLPNDGTGTGVPGESLAFSVTNNSLPNISAVTTSVVGSNVNINYLLADTNGDTCSLAVFYSLDNGVTFTQTNSLTGSINVAPGAGMITWNSLTDFTSNSGNIRVKIVPNDGKGNGTAGLSSSFALSNNSLPAVSISAVGGSAGPVSITYDLTDTEQNACAIEVYYSTNGGISYTRTTSLSGITSNLSPATGRTITWNSGDDFTGLSDAVFVRVVANDGFGNGNPGIFGPFSVNNNAAPVISSLVNTGNSGNISLSFTLADANSHVCDLTLDYSVDGGATWASATGITGTMIGVTPGSGRTLTWDSRQNFTSNESNVKLRLTPRDPYESGAGVPTGVFVINNNRLPVLNNVVVSGNSGDISVSFSLSDEDSDDCDVSVAYSVDGGGFTITGNVASSAAPIPPGTGINLVWKSASDIKFNSSNIRLKLTPNDGIGNGTSGESIVFALNNNELPVISNAVVAMSGEVATFTYDLFDATIGDLCDVSLLYSTNNGSTWQAATSFSGDKNDLASGNGKVITWNTLNDLPGKYASVRVRLLPNDGTGNGTPGETTPLVVNNNRLPVINNVVVTGSSGQISVTYSLTDLDSDSCNITVAYSVDGGLFPNTANVSGSVASIQPGTGINLVWNTVADSISFSSNVRLRLTPNDGGGNGTPGESVVFTVNNVNELPVVSNVAVTQSGKTATFTFDLADANNDQCSVAVAYSIDNGSTWLTANNVTGDLTGVISGTGRRITWRTSPDIAALNNVKVRLLPNDGTANGNAGISPVFIVDNTPPAVSNVRVTKKSDGTHDVLYDLVYPSLETTCSVAIWYSTNDGVSWSQTTDQLPATGILPANDLALNWDSSVDLPGPATYTVKLEVRPSEGVIDGTSTRSAAFKINTPPVVAVLIRESEDPRGPNTTFTGDIKMKFNIDSSFSNGTYTATIQYTLNNGTSWTNIIADRALTGFKPGENEVVWESYRNSAVTTASTVRMKVTVTDGVLISEPAYCPASFTLSNAHIPNINKKFIDVSSMGSNSTAVVTSDKFLYVWGYSFDGTYGNYFGYQGSYAQKTAVTVSSHTSLVGVIQCESTYMGLLILRDDGKVYCVGRQFNGELGNGVGAYGAYGYDWLNLIQPTGLGFVTSISASPYHTLALQDDGLVMAFGYNNYGQLGDGTITQRNAPVPVVGLYGVEAIAAGGYSNVGFSLALKTDGTVWSWGYNAQGQLGLGDVTQRLVPVQIPTLSGVKSIAAGATHAMFLLDNGEVWACGHIGAKNYGSTPVKVSLTPANDPAGLLVDIQKIFAGGTAANLGNCFAVDSGGHVFAWGDNAHGQLGLNNTISQATPVKIPGLSRINVITTNTNTSYRNATFCSFAPSGTSGIWTAGYGYYGQLGAGTTNYPYFYHP